MHMRVNQPRNEKLAGPVDALRIVRRLHMRADLRDASVANEHRHVRQSLRWGDERDVADDEDRQQDAVHPLFLRAERESVNYHIMPSCSFAASDIMLRSHTGSNTTSTSAAFTPGRDSIFPLTSCASTGPMPHPGAVSVILIFTLCPPPSAGCTSHR